MEFLEQPRRKTKALENPDYNKRLYVYHHENRAY
jgi:hypothetical protein